MKAIAAFFCAVAIAVVAHGGESGILMEKVAVTADLKPVEMNSSVTLPGGSGTYADVMEGATPTPKLPFVHEHIWLPSADVQRWTAMVKELDGVRAALEIRFNTKPATKLEYVVPLEIKVAAKGKTWVFSQAKKAK